MLYVLLAVTVGWVLFRSVSLGQAGAILTAMAGFARGDGTAFEPALYLSHSWALAVTAGIIGSMALRPALAPWASRLGSRGRADGVPAAQWLLEGARCAALAGVLWLSILRVAAGTYNPFIYYRF